MPSTGPSQLAAATQRRTRTHRTTRHTGRLSGAPRARRLGVAASLATAALVLGGCGDNGDSGAGGSELDVVVGFYPLEFLVDRIGGDLVTLETLTAPGIDPHDLALSPREVGGVGSADLVVYASGMQSAVDAAVDQQNPDRALDASEAAGLLSPSADASEESHDDDGDDGDDHDHADDTDHHGHDHDPHFWLDPTRYAQVAEAITQELAAVDPENAATYQANGAALVDELTALDEAYRSGLDSCEFTEVVTTHAAFGYLTERYGLEQVAMTGISPESEPTPGRMAQIARQVEELGVPTIYSELLAGTRIADTIANETDVEVLQLDPIEGLSDASAGDDYLKIMEANLEALRTGQVCS